MQDLTSLNDNDLIREVKGGNFNAFQVLIFRHDSKVLSIAARYTNNAEDAKDIYQDVLIRAYRGLNGFKNQSEFSTWLYRIMTNVCISSYRNRKKFYTMNSQYTDSEDQLSRSQHLEKGGSPTPHEQMTTSEISDRVTDALNLLSPQQKLVFTLRHYEGYKLAEIAKFMKCTEGTVKKQLFTAIRKLRGDLKDLYSEGLS